MSHTRHVLLVCLHGAAKSVLAAADCERLAAARGLHTSADFAGTEPDADIAPAVAAVLHADGVDFGGKKPRLVTRQNVAVADRVVAFGCELGEAAAPGARVDQWREVPAVGDGLPAARAAIHARLGRRLDEWRTP